MLGEKGLREASSMAILNANYMLKRMEENDAYDILYKVLSNDLSIYLSIHLSIYQSIYLFLYLFI
jgi:glycine cleavage system protein P-like pyridoxal-binding family